MLSLVPATFIAKSFTKTRNGLRLKFVLADGDTISIPFSRICRVAPLNSGAHVTYMKAVVDRVIEATVELYQDEKAEWATLTDTKGNVYEVPTHMMEYCDES
jgi:hypothetical protein